MAGERTGGIMIFLVDFYDADPKDTKDSMIKIQEKKFHVLIPKEFKNMTGNYTVFEYVAIWNREYLCPEMVGRKPHLEQFRGFDENLGEMYKEEGKSDAEIKLLSDELRKRFYDEAITEYNRDINRLQDFRVLSDGEMKDKYGVDFLHDIGVSIFKSHLLVYPLKVSYNADLTYEEARSSVVIR